MNQLRTVVVDNKTQAAGITQQYMLPINPLSHLVFTLKCLNVTNEATLAEILARITKIEISRLGESSHDVSMADLYALNAGMFGHEPILTNMVADDNGVRALTLYIPFGRKLYDPDECFPGTRKGEFVMAVTTSATETACDNIMLLVEGVELLGATPKRHLKVGTLIRAVGGTGELDQDVPIGNPYAGMLLFSTTIPTTTAWTTTLEWIKLKKDNVEFWIARTKWDALHGDFLRRIGYLGDHSAAWGDDLLANYAWLEFDPHGDDRFLVPTKGASSMKLVIYAGDANPWRVLPLELRSV